MPASRSASAAPRNALVTENDAVARRAARRRRDAAGRRRGARLRRLPGQRRDDARAFRRGRRGGAAARAARAFQLRRRHPHGAGARRGFLRRAGRHAHRAGRSAQRRTRRRWCCSIPTASWSTASGRRFFDEGAGLVHETWEAFSRHLHFDVPGRTAYAILDARVRANPRLAARHALGGAAVRGRYARRTRRADRRRCGRPRRARSRTTTPPAPAIRRNSTPQSATASPRRASLAPPKSNWARAIAEPPFLAWPLIGAIAYTFGGLATDTRARVLRGGAPIPGLYAAGEITGHFYGTAPNAVSVLRAFVFGRIAGREAVGFLSAPRKIEVPPEHFARALRVALMTHSAGLRRAYRGTSLRQCPEPEVRAIAQRVLSRTSGSKGHWNHSASSVAWFGSSPPVQAGALANFRTATLAQGNQQTKGDLTRCGKACLLCFCLVD